MPAIINGDSYGSGPDLRNMSYDYQYPDGLDLKPGSELHDKLKDAILERARVSAMTMSTRHSTWNSIDHTLTAYIAPDVKETAVKEKDERKPISVVFPYSYTVLETLLSYFVAAFLQDPIFRYEGVGPNDVIGAILLEKMIGLQCIKSRVGLNLHTQARDSFAYGFGVVTPTWTVEKGTKTVTTEKPRFMGFGSKIETSVQDVTVFEGNALENVDPYLYLPDVNVPIHDPQKGEYVGWVSVGNLMDMLSQEQGDPTMFNVKYLKSYKGRKTSIFTSDNSGRATKSGMSPRLNSTDSVTNGVDKIKMFIKLIPKDWNLGSGEYPEIWYFELCADEVITCARPTKLSHRKFPVSVIAPDYDGYSMAPISRIEILNGLQGVLDFMFNSHIANVRKAIHDMIIYDPYQVNSNDLKNPSAGKLIRLRRPAWGRGVKDVAQQLLVSDVTRGNVADSTWIVQWMDRISGADASMQGSLRQGGPERLTSAEFQGTMGGGINRLERIAKVVGMQGMQDIGTFFAAHNKQMMTVPGYVKMAGDWEDVLIKEYGYGGQGRGRVEVTPDLLDINYDVVVRDGSVPGGNYSSSWIELFKTVTQVPELAQKFDVVRIFSHIARNLGAKNVNEFVRKGGNIQAQSMPNEMVDAQVQQGNLIPVEGQEIPGGGY